VIESAVVSLFDVGAVNMEVIYLIIQKIAAEILCYVKNEIFSTCYPSIASGIIGWGGIGVENVVRIPAATTKKTITVQKSCILLDDLCRLKLSFEGHIK
jgi:hypothetical protein